jgi:FG-GAP-like repeat
MSRRPWALGCLLIFVALTRIGAQAGSFSGTDVSSSAGTRGIVAVDLNGDGWLDLALANNDPDTATVLLNDGATGGFTPSRTTTLGGGPFDITAGDFDRDGRVDLAVANADANAIDVLLTTRAGGLKASRRFAAAGGPRGLTATDIDRDGRLDIAYTSFSLHAVVVLFGDGAGNFSNRGIPATTLSANTSRPQGLVGGDFNHDGKTDLAVAETGAKVLSVLNGDGTGRFSRRMYFCTDTLNVVSAGDFDDDGWTDFAAGSTAGSSVTFFSGGAPGLTLRGRYGVPQSPRGIAVADFNQDGRQDVVVANRDADMVTVLLNGGTWSSFSTMDLRAANGSRTVAAGDFNHDGKPEFAVGAEYAGATSVFSNQIALIRGGFAFERQNMSVPNREVNAELPASFTAADVNHNGIPDLFSGRSVLIDGTAPKTLLSRANSVGVGVRVADLNHDGHPDLILQSASVDPNIDHFDGVDFLLGNGRGDFARSSAIGGMANPVGLAVGDLNRDGWDDFVIARRITFTQTSIEVYLNGKNTSITFAPRRMTETGVFHDLALGDVDADGDLDIVLTFESPTGINVLKNSGGGAFPTGAEQSMNDPGLRLALGDMNEDGLLDAVMLRQTAIGSTLSVALGQGNGLFADPVDYPTGLSDGGVALALALGDATGDGHLDAFGSAGGTEIDPGVSTLLSGRGDGTMAPPDRFTPSLSSMTILDFNRDGLADILGHDWSGVSILTNRRSTQNHQPVALAEVAGLTDPHPPGTVGSWKYEERLYSDADFVGLNASASNDVDLHALTYEWRDEAGNILRPERTTPWFDPGVLDAGTYRYRLTVRDGRGGVDSIVFTLHVLPFKEIVIHVSATGIEQGTWQRFADSTAANGESIGTVSAGVPKVNAPLANPSNFVDVYFTPDPSQTYKLWIRGKAQNNSWANDSAWVQFSHAVDASGKPVYRIGTTAGLPYNLEECSNCGVSGWGWEDDGWGAVNRNGVTLHFNTPTRFERLQWIRVQTREDGLVIDQIVLSAERYLTTRPGSAKNDRTILLQTQF